MRPAALAALLAALVLVAGCGGSSNRSPADPDRVALEAANSALVDDPAGPGALGNVVRVAYRGASNRYDPDTGGFRPSARLYLDRAAAVWPRYLAVAGPEPSGMLASVMVRVYGDGLGRPADAAKAARLAAEANPSAPAFLQETLWSARAGDRRGARLAGQKALELARPDDREEVREAIQRSLSEAP